MADAYLGYRPRFQQPVAVAPTSGAAIPPLKRRHLDYGAAPVGSGQRVIYPGEEAMTSISSMADTESINASYDQYLRNGMGTFGAANPVHGLTGALPVRPVDDSRALGVGVMDSRPGAYGGVRRSEAPLPPPLPQDATNTLFVDGLPADCSRREVSHIFRPFIGYREVRLVTKESKHRGGEKFLLCFVDFTNASQASAALDALQGEQFSNLIIYMATHHILLRGFIVFPTSTY